MLKISNLIGKPLLTIFEPKYIGTVTNVVFDVKLKKALALKVENEEEEGTVYYVPLKAVRSLKKDAAVVVSGDSLKKELEGEFVLSPINTRVYNQDGKFFGTVIDVELVESKVSSIKTNCGNFPPTIIISHSDALIFFKDVKKRFRSKASA